MKCYPASRYGHKRSGGFNRALLDHSLTPMGHGRFFATKTVLLPSLQPEPQVRRANPGCGIRPGQSRSLLLLSFFAQRPSFSLGSYGERSPNFVPGPF